MAIKDRLILLELWLLIFVFVLMASIQLANAMTVDVALVQQPGTVSDNTTVFNADLSSLASCTSTPSP